MPLVVALSEIPPDRIEQPGRDEPGSPGALNTTFFRARREEPDAPTARINRYRGEGKSGISAAHFHEVDQFQVIMDGSGDFGRHPVKPYCIHFSRAYTPYGPLAVGPENGLGLPGAALALRSGGAALPAVPREAEADSRPSAVAGHDGRELPRPLPGRQRAGRSARSGTTRDSSRRPSPWARHAQDERRTSSAATVSTWWSSRAASSTTRRNAKPRPSCSSSATSRHSS